MQNRALKLFILLFASGSSAVCAQTAPSRAAQTRPDARVQQTEAVRATNADRVTGAAPTAQQSGAAGKQVIPANLFQMDDRAIIIVGGRQVAAGDIKRAVSSELQQLSGPARTMRSASRIQASPENPPGAPVRNDPGIIKPARKPDAGRAAVATGSSHRDAALGGSRASAIGKDHSMSYVETRDYCLTRTAEISRVRGSVTPNARFTIEGMCFGAQIGAVEVIGQFPGGSMKLVFERWSDTEITAFVPAVSGAADHAVALTIVRSDKTRSPAVQARFVAARERVAVPARFWSPTSEFGQVDVDQGGGNIFTGSKVWGTGPGDISRSTPFTLTVNPACALDDAAWATRTGRVDSFNGWENGPAHQANVEVVWTPQCTIQTTSYVFGSSSQKVCSIGFSLAAWASCPVGVSP